MHTRDAPYFFLRKHHSMANHKIYKRPVTVKGSLIVHEGQLANRVNEIHKGVRFAANRGGRCRSLRRNRLGEGVVESSVFGSDPGPGAIFIGRVGRDIIGTNEAVSNEKVFKIMLASSLKL